MKSRIGQNFLTSKVIARRIVEAADIKSGDVILEIGPGKGILTEAILEKNPKKLIAVEKDRNLLEELKHGFFESRIKNYETGVDVIYGDILDFFRDSKFIIHNSVNKIVANIPYYITSRLLRLIFSQKNLPERVVLMLQREVAERICARPPHMNLLALSVQIYGRPKIAFRVSKTFFKPRPKVDSAVIVIDNISRDFFKNIGTPGVHTDAAEEKFFELLHAGFRHKRKLLLKNLANYTSEVYKEVWINAFAICGLNEKLRTENLAFEDWICLERFLAASARASG